ncbi:MAG TPA: glycoside hydrolase family 38 C-terminal domain-containing protein, partial [Ktedonobacterales bacterium]|nr:glycoside hydrolase family 38 C-terminal domain-containing protein [Ktedonobacterales bacterium]
GRADRYFRDLREQVGSQDSLPTWDGELYLEYHRGVYTTQAWLKRLHRRIEERLLLAESLDAARWAHAYIRGGAAPDARVTLDDCWRTLLLHEFHDILPGSSIAPVYADAREALTALAERLDSFIAQAQRDIADQSHMSGMWLLHNPSPVSTPGGASIIALALGPGEQPPTVANPGDSERPLTMQIVTEPDGATTALYGAPAIPGRGWLTLRPTQPPKPHSQAPDSGRPHASASPDGGVILENTYYACSLDAQGQITSLVDKRVGSGRELMPAGQAGNAFIAFEDRPRTFDAWDIDAWYTRKPYPLDSAQVTITEHGPLRATVHVTRTFLNSVIEQDISLTHNSPRVDFVTHVDWHEHNLLLKVAFPLDMRVTHARSEIQYGSIARPTHSNTSWDQARFETVAHRWVDLSEGDYGVALLNDGRYGHDIHESVVRLTVLRSPTVPDPEADQGAHDVTFSLLPHLGAWPSGEVVAHGYALNRPLRVIRPQREGASTNQPAPPLPLFSVEGSAAIIEAVKRAAEGDDLIVRVYESTGSRAEVKAQCAYPIERIVETDLLERPLSEGVSPAFDLWEASPVASHDMPQLHETGWRCQLRPFEIRTFRVTLRHP